MTLIAKKNVSLPKDEFEEQKRQYMQKIKELYPNGDGVSDYMLSEILANVTLSMKESSEKSE